MINLKLNPAFKLLILIIPSFVIGKFISIPLTILIGISILLLAVFGIITKFSNPVIFFLVLVSLIGLNLSQITRIETKNIPKKIIPDFRAFLKGTVTNVNKESDKQIRLLVSGSIDPTFYSELTNVKILLTVFKQSREFKLNPGSVINCTVNASPPKFKQIYTDFDEVNYAEINDIDWFASTSSSKIQIIENATPTWTDALKEKIYLIISSFVSKDNAAIAYAMVTGDQTKVDYETKKNYTSAGTAHVIAVSGLQIGLIAFFITLFIRFIKYKIIRFAIFSTLVSIYVIFTGSSPSSIRAGIMALLVYLIIQFQRSYSLLNILSITVIIVVLFNPLIINSASFQLSFLSVLSISLFYPLITNKLQLLFKTDSKVHNFLLNSFSLTLSTSLIVTPLSAYIFGKVCVYALFSNILVIPFTMLATLFITFGLIIFPINISISILYFLASDVLFNLSSGVNTFFNNLPFNNPEVPNLVLISSVISIVLLYIFFSNNFRTFSFRLIISIIIITFSYFLSKDLRTGYYEIIPRKNFVGINCFYNDSAKIVIIERKKQSYLKSDYSYHNYINNIKNKSCYLISGINGLDYSTENIRDSLLEVRVKMKSIIKINELTMDKYKLYQYIDVNKWKI